MNKHGDLRVWHITQLPGKPFIVSVSSVEEASKILETIWKYDSFQWEENIKPDYSSVSGLELYDAELDEWCEWYSDNDEDIVEYMDGIDDE